MSERVIYEAGEIGGLCTSILVIPGSLIETKESSFSSLLNLSMNATTGGEQFHHISSTSVFGTIC